MKKPTLYTLVAVFLSVALFTHTPHVSAAADFDEMGLYQKLQNFFGVDKAMSMWKNAFGKAPEGQLAAVVTVSSGAQIDFDINRDLVVNSKDPGALATAIDGKYVYNTTNARYDLDANKIIDKNDWKVFASYCDTHATICKNTLFDIDANGSVTSAEVTRFAVEIQKVMDGTQGYQVRYDLNADDANNVNDWSMVLGFVMQNINKPIFTYDFLNGDGVITNSDFEIFATQIQRIREGALPYQIRYDVNADSRVDLTDWRMVLSYFVETLNKPEYVYVILSSSGGPIKNIATQLQRIREGALQYQFRYDFNGDGNADISDWRTTLAYVSQKLNKPEYLYDINGDAPSGPSTKGPISIDEIDKIATDLQRIREGALQYQFRYDVNGDGYGDVSDWRMTKNYVLYSAKYSTWWIDLNSDSVVNTADITVIKNAVGSGKYSIRYDLNTDGLLSDADVRMVSSY